MMSLRTAPALLIPLSMFAVGCVPAHDEDRVEGVALAGSTVVVTGRTTQVGGYGCGGLDEGTPALFVSGDSGATFDRFEPDGDRPFDAIGTRAGTFFALRGGYDGFTVESSTDGVTWTERATGTTSAHDLLVDDSGVHVAHGAGVLSSADGLVWTDHTIDGGNLYLPRLARVGDLLVLATGDGAMQISADGATWAPRAVDGVMSVHRLASVGGRAIAIAHADRNGDYGNFLVEFDPASDDDASFAKIDDSVMAVVETPSGMLVGDGTIATRGGLGDRLAHTSAFVAGAVEGRRVGLVSERGLALSTDGGATFGATVALPLVK